MTTYSDIVKDEVSGQPVANVSVYVYNLDKTLATITPTNPVVTDSYGEFSFTAADGIYRVSYVVGGKTVEKDYIIVGVGPSIPTDVVAALIPYQAKIDSSLAGAQTSAGQAATSATQAGVFAAGASALNTYATTAAGITATTNGQVFYVPSADGSYAQLWKNVSGVATIQTLQIPGVAMQLANLKKQLGLPDGVTVHAVLPDLGQMFKADGSAVTAPGDAVASIVPVGETAGSAFTLNLGGTYRVDANGVGYIEMTAGLNNGTIAGTFNLTPNTYVSVAMARDTDSASDGLVLTANSSAQAIKIGFVAGGAQVRSSSVRNGSFPFLDSRHAVAPLQTMTVIDFLLEAGAQSSWINNSVRDAPDPTPLDAGLRRGTNTWTGADSFSGATLTLNLPTKGGIRFGGFIFIQGTLGVANRRAANKVLMRRHRLQEMADNSYGIWIFPGDSNDMGVGDQLTSTAVPFGQGAQYIDTGALIPLKDPIQGMWPDQFSGTGSRWPAFAKTIYDLTGEAACIVGCANGTGVGLWAGSGIYSGGWLGSNLMPVAARKVKGAIGDVRGVVRGVVTGLGFNDKGLGKTKAQFIAGYVAFRDMWRVTTGIPDLPLFLISVDTVADGSETQLAVIRQAQIEAAANEGIYLAVPYQNWLGSGHHQAGLGNPHLDQAAYNSEGVIAATYAAGIVL